jgi:hypothetical protein
VNAAQRAFRERDPSRARHASLVFDSFIDGHAPAGGYRLLMFGAEGFDLVLTVASTPRGNLMEGALLGDAKPKVVAVRRPMRPTIAIAVRHDGRLSETLVPPGIASVTARCLTGEIWQSDWLTL